MNETLPLQDILAKDLSVVFCGINPGLKSALVGLHFANRSNRFWRVLHRSEFTPRELQPEEAPMLLDYGLGLTMAVERPTARADQLTGKEFIESASTLAEKISAYEPECIAFLGKQAYAALTGRRDIAWGPQDALFVGAKVWVLPNPSGLNRGFSLDELVSAYAELRAALTDR